MPRAVHPAVALAAIIALGACNEVRSLEPAITAREAVEVPGLAGRWRYEDSTDKGVIEIERVPGATPAWRVRAVDAKGTEPWGQARTGRIGAHLVLELRPPEPSRIAALATPADSTGARHVYNLYTIAVVDTLLRVGIVRPDSALARVRDGRCPSPHLRDTTKSLTLTGTSAQVRAAYACLLRLPAATDTFSLPRVR